MSKAMDHIHPIAVQVKDIDQSVIWCSKHFICDIAYHDKS